MIPLLALTAVLTSPTIPPIDPVPSPAQLAWEEMETNAFVHFGPNTFNDVEWGGGHEDPNSFNPTAMDCNQWVRVFKKAGFKGVIITAKHHDGFCLWPSKLSTHTVAQSGWKHGKGDVLRELSEACRREGLKFGVYLSPWDRNHPSYGTPEYNQVYASMLKEVLGNYGPVFEVWFDGANGEGPNGKKQVYDWQLFESTVHAMQPHAVIFGGWGPGIRWVGNEDGQGSTTSWSMIPSGKYGPSTPLYAELGEGSETGDMWSPPECDVSIASGWFFHPDEKIKSGRDLFRLYEHSVGRNSLLLLNVPPDRTGKIPPNEEEALIEYRHLVESVYGKNLAFPDRLSAEADSTFSVKLHHPATFNRVLIGEEIALGQRVSSFHVDAHVPDGEWHRVAEGTTIGHKRILEVPSQTADGIRVVVDQTRAQPVLTKFGLYLAPE